MLAAHSRLNQSCGTSLAANPITRSKTVRSSLSGSAEVVVETEVFRSVRSAIRSDQFPILVLGAGGSGKTTLLRTMCNEWVQAGRRALYIQLGRVSRNEDLYLLLRNELGNESTLSPLQETSVFASSGRETLRSTVAIVKSLPFEPLLLFDGLSEMPDSSGVLQLLNCCLRRRRRSSWRPGINRTPPEAAASFDQSSRCPNLPPPTHTISCARVAV